MCSVYRWIALGCLLVVTASRADGGPALVQLNAVAPPGQTGFNVSKSSANWIDSALEASTNYRYDDQIVQASAFALPFPNPLEYTRLAAGLVLQKDPTKSIHANTLYTVGAHTQQTQQVFVGFPQGFDPTGSMLRLYFDISGQFRVAAQTVAALALQIRSGPTEWGYGLGSANPSGSWNKFSAKSTTPGVIDIEGEISIDIRLFALRPGVAYSEYIINLSATAAGTTNSLTPVLVAADFGNTISLDRITFLDGSTPESRGMSLTFSPAMVSPNNVTATPEPSTLAGAGLAGVLGMVVARRSRARLAA